MEIEMQESRKFEPIEVPDGVYEAEIVDLKDIEIEDKKTKERRKVVDIGFKISEGNYVGKIVRGFAMIASFIESTSLSSGLNSLL